MDDLEPVPQDRLIQLQYVSKVVWILIRLAKVGLVSKKAVVESIMLGIPLPTIILHGSETGIHEVIGGNIDALWYNSLTVPWQIRQGDFMCRDVYDHETRRCRWFWRIGLLWKIPVLTFEDVSDSTLKSIQTYNTASRNWMPPKSETRLIKHPFMDGIHTRWWK